MSPNHGLRTFFLFVCLVSFFSVEKCLCDDKLNVTTSGQNETDVVDDYSKFTRDDELISDLVTAPIFDIDSETDPGSDIAKILKILEVAEREQAAATSASTTTTPIKNIPETTQGPSTETGSDDDDVDVKEAVAYLDTIIEYLNETVVKTYKENGLPLPENLDLSELSDDDNDDDDNLQTLERRSSHDHAKPPTLNGLLWKTTLALWDLTSPAFYRTLPGQKVKLVSDAVALPFRTYGAVKHAVNDLVQDPLGRRLGFGWGHHHHAGHHHHHHGWGHEYVDGPVYVAHEPENSLFKLWLRFLYRSIRPAIVAKIRVHVMTIRIRIRMILALANFLRRVKILKFVATFKSLVAKVRLLRQRLTQQVVVLKETDHIHVHDHGHKGWGWEPPPPPPPPPPPMTTTTPAPPTPGWGWGWGGWGGWGSGGGGGGWGSGRTDTSGAVPVQSYGPPKPTTPMGMSMEPMMAYGPPAAMEPSSMYGPPMETSGSVAPTPSPDAAASSAAFNYDYNNPPPSDYLVAPADSSSNNEADLPSYASYLRDFGINPLSLSEADKQKDLPYLVSPSPSSNEDSENKKEIFKRQTEQMEEIPIRRI